jgi:hypothetical protein
MSPNDEMNIKIDPVINNTPVTTINPASLSPLALKWRLYQQNLSKHKQEKYPQTQAYRIESL